MVEHTQGFYPNGTTIKGLFVELENLLRKEGRVIVKNEEEETFLLVRKL